MEKLYKNFKKYAKKAYKQVEPLVPFSNANQYAFNPRSELHNNSQALDIQNDTDILNQQMANYRANQNGTFMLNALTKSDKEKQKDSIDFDNKFIDLAYSKGYTPHKAIDKDGKARYAIEKDGVLKEIEPSFLNELKANSYEMLGSLAGVATALPLPLTKTAGVAGKILTPMVGSAVGSGAGAMADTYLNNKSVGENTTSEQLANSFIGGANNDILAAGLATTLTSKPAINIAKGTLKAPLEVLDKGLTGVGARHILSQNIGGAQSALKANLGGDHEFRNALESAKDALGADLDNFVRTDLKTINKTSDNRYIQKGIDIANSAINRVNETLKGLNVGRADAELLLSALGHENGVKNILDAVANNPQSAQKITEISSNLNKSFAGSINEQLAKFETQTPKDSFKNSFNQVKKDYADTKDFLIKNSNYQSDFKELSENLATILSDTQNINTRGVFNALNGGGNLENLLNAKNAINEQLGYIISADFKSSSDFINQKALNEAKSLIDNEINTALKNDENLINLYKSANGDYATMKNIVDSNLMNQISRDGKTSLEALNAMIKSNENINGVTLNEFLSSLGAKDRAIAEANIIKGLMEKNSINGVVDFRALNQSLNSLDFGSEFAKELKSQILNRQALLNNTSDILNALGSKVVKSKSMSQGISTDPLKRAETMKANFIVDKLKPLIPRLGNNEALKLHLNRAILNANGDFKLAIKNIDNIPDGNLPTPTRNLLNEFKKAVKEIEQVVKNNSDDVPPSGGAGVVNGGNIDSLTQQISYLQNALKNSTKDTPTPSTVTKEADNLSETTPNLTQNSIKGDGFVISGNGVEPKSDLSVKISVDEWVKELAGINPNKQIIADLEHLYEKHKELFSKPSEVFKLIKAVKDNPTFFYTNNQPNIALIGSILENGKLGKIGIQKDFNSDNLQVRHATYSSNAKKENERLLKRNSYPVGSPTPTQLTFGKTAEPTANGAKALLGKKEKAVSGDALPPHLDADNISLTGRYSVGGKPHLTAFDENIIPQNAKNEVKEQTKSTQINEQAVKTKAEPITQVKQETQAKADEADKKAKLDEEFAKNKAYVEGLEREAINKIEALHNFNKTAEKGASIPLKSIISQAEQELKEFARLRAKETGASQERINNVKIKSLDDLKNHLDSLGLYIAKTKDKEGEALLNKYVEILNDISEARLNQRAIKKQNETQKDDLIKGVVDSLKGLQIVGLRNLSNFLTKYGKTDEFMTKANPKWKSQFDKARALMERDQNITPIREFGTNYAEFYRDGENAIKKLLVERQGQVAGAFHKDGRDITISWGEAKMANGDIKGYGLSKIEAKHLNDFAIFEGSTPQEKMANGINEIIEKGKIVSDDGIDTIWYKKGDRAYVVGLSKGFNGVGDTSWVVTSYEKKNVVGDSKALSANAKFNEIKSPISTNTETIPNQSIKQAETAKDLTADAPSELYKAHRKAQKAKETAKSQEPQATKQAETTAKEPTTQAEPNTNSRLEKIKKFIEGKTNKALDSDIKTYNELYRYVLDDFAKAHPDELNLPKYASEMANYITKEFLVKHDKEIKEIITQKTSGENRQIVLNAFENLKENFDELRSVGIGDLRKPTAKDIKDKIAEIEIKSMSDKELVTQFQKLKDSKARVNENLYKYLENEIKKREKKLYPFINSDKKDYSYDLEKQLKNRGLMGLKDSELENIAKERNSVLYLPSYIRENIEQELNIKPIKEFGTNYAEFYHDGVNAIKKLLTERQGQVAGAFEREELGDIDLVWGNEKIGLNKIILKHLKDFESFKGDTPQEKLVNGISEIITNGKIINENGIDTIWYKKDNDYYLIGLSKGFDNKGENNWIITAYEKTNLSIDKKARIDKALKGGDSKTISAYAEIKSSKTPELTTAENSTTTANKSQDPTTQPKWANKFKTKMAKMGQEYNDEKIANLANWHKDSHAVTKESDGSPKLFYHGTNVKFDAFDIDKSKRGWLGKSFYFTDSKSKAKGYGKNVISTYLNLKNPYISKANDHYSFVNEVKEQFGVKENYGEFDPAQVLKEHGYDGVVYKDWDDEVGTIYTAFSPNQIKSITNKGTFNPNSKMMNGFSTMAMQKAILHLGSGGIGGVMNANAEQDPNKKAEAFVKGFLLGAGGSVGAIKMLENSAKLAPQLAQVSQRLAKDLPMILNDRPDIVGKALGRTPKENYNYIFGGENAIGANKAKLKTAGEMAKNGADESEIWAKTGWYKDIDKKWKFEINPKGAELDISALKKATPNKLGDILKDDELFKAYPQVKDLSILPTQTKDGADAAYQETEVFGLRRKAILFNDDYLQNATNDEIRSTLYHEIQHAIQSIEGFGAGGSTQKLSYQEYKNLAGESEARNVEKRLNRTYSKDDAIDGEFNRLLIKDMDNPKWQELKQKWRELVLAGKLDEADKIKKQLDQRQEFLKREAVKNVKEFSSYSPHPFKTLDINPNDRVVKYGSGMSASYTPKQKEVRGVYNVAFNEKRATQIYKDIEDVENVIKFEKGRADNISANKDGFGSLHIQKHLDPKNEGYITTQEYLNMGEYIRKAGDFKESGGKRVYDYTDENGVRFRAIIGDTRGGKDRVISFFSNRKAGSAYDRQNYTRNQPLSENSTPKEIKSQAQVEQKAKQYAKWLSQADKIPPQAPDELYKAYNKAKRT